MLLLTGSWTAWKRKWAETWAASWRSCANNEWQRAYRRLNPLQLEETRPKHQDLSILIRAGVRIPGLATPYLQRTWWIVLAIGINSFISTETSALNSDFIERSGGRINERSKFATSQLCLCRSLWSSDFIPSPGVAFHSRCLRNSEINAPSLTNWCIFINQCTNVLLEKSGWMSRWRS